MLENSVLCFLVVHLKLYKNVLIMDRISLASLVVGKLTEKDEESQFFLEREGSFSVVLNLAVLVKQIEGHQQEEVNISNRQRMFYSVSRECPQSIKLIDFIFWKAKRRISMHLLYQLYQPVIVFLIIIK